MNPFTQPETDYYGLVKRIVTMGATQPSRFGDTVEILDKTVIFPAGRMWLRPGFNKALGFMELMQLVAGVYDPGALAVVAPKALHNLFTKQMAYGPRLAPQIHSIIGKLIEDPGTRQAIAFIGSREDGPTNDQPCTSTVQFLIRDRRLHAVIGMRSWDVIRGMVYDIMMFGGLVQFISRCLPGTSPGWVSVRAGSCHVYLADSHLFPDNLTTGIFTCGDDNILTWGDCVRIATEHIALGVSIVHKVATGRWETKD